ncbi:hypothetical protein L7F22_032272 [Adiantum nelumboides]|nr:hypothetical protein [Adiantum nelumboides]
MVGQRPDKEGFFLPVDPTSSFMLPNKIQMWDRQMDCKALLDFAANACLMHKDFARKQGIPLVEKSFPIIVKVINGCPLASGNVKYKTHPIEVTLKDHLLWIAFNIIQCPSISIVIGLPWLELHNPSIDWRSQRVEPRQAQKKERKPRKPTYIGANVFLHAAKKSPIFLIFVCNAS